MTVILRPPGRGNWAPVVMTIEPSRHAPLPLYVLPGQLVTIAGQVLRVVRMLEG